MNPFHREAQRLLSSFQQSPLASFLRSVSPAPHDDEFLVANANPIGPGSLHAALASANELGLQKVMRGDVSSSTCIRFDSEVSEPMKICLSSPLPALATGRVKVLLSMGGECGVILSSLIPFAFALCLASSQNRVDGVCIEGGFRHGIVVAGEITGNVISGCEVRHSVGQKLRAGVVLTDGATENVFERCLVSGCDTLGVYVGPGCHQNVFRDSRFLHNDIGIMVSRSERCEFAGCLIAGNAQVGCCLTGRRTRGSVIRDCCIGVEVVEVEGKSKQTRLIQNHVGIVIHGLASENVIGPGNVISGNIEIGIYIETSTRNIIKGNIIGPDATGLTVVRDAQGLLAQGNGIEFNSVAKENFLGGEALEDRNIISGNRVYGVVYYGHCSRNPTIGNYIGTDLNGTKSLPNATGICVDCSAFENLIARNLISGNMSYGLFLVTRGTVGNIVESNLVGTDASGKRALPNDIGMVVSTGASRNVLRRNVFSGNTQAGLMITNRFTEENIVEENVFGMDLEQTLPIPNCTGVILSSYPIKNILRRNCIRFNEMGIVICEYAHSNALIENAVSENTKFDMLRTMSEDDAIAAYPTPPPRPSLPAVERRQDLPRAILPPLLIPRGRRVLCVTSGADAGAGTLREAMTNCISGRGTCTVTFNIPPEDPSFDAANGTWRIALRSSLPALTVSDVVIDGASQTHAQGVRNCYGPEIVLDGCENTVEHAFHVQFASNIVIRGVCIIGFCYGIQIFGKLSCDNSVVGCHVGIDSFGFKAMGNFNGIELLCGASRNVIGGKTPAERNIISGNHHCGVRVVDASENFIFGNYIGTDRTGSVAVPNHDGISIEGKSARNVIGGKEPGACNLCSGNVAYGIDLFGWNVSNNSVLGNFVGTDATGKFGIPNTYGVLFDDRAHDNIVVGNLISGNTAFGMYIYNNGTNSNSVQGNLIGTDVTGMISLPNETGVQIDGGAHSNIVDSNVISGNLLSGINLFSVKTDRNRVTRNLVGVAKDRRTPLENGGNGIRIVFGPAENVIGGEGEGVGNVIAHNRMKGVMIEQGAHRARMVHNLIVGNHIHSNGTS